MKEMQKGQKMNENKRLMRIGALILMIAILLTVGGIIYFEYEAGNMSKGAENAQEDSVYDAYYVMIVEEPTSDFWVNAYESAKETAKENKAEVSEEDKEQMKFIKLLYIILLSNKGHSLTLAVKRAIFSECNILLSHRTNFFSTSNGGFDSAIFKQEGNHCSEHSGSMIRSSTEFSGTGHLIFTPYW